MTVGMVMYIYFVIAVCVQIAILRGVDLDTITTAFIHVSKDIEVEEKKAILMDDEAFAVLRAAVKKRLYSQSFKVAVSWPWGLVKFAIGRLV